MSDWKTLRILAAALRHKADGMRSAVIRGELHRNAREWEQLADAEEQCGDDIAEEIDTAFAGRVTPPLLVRWANIYDDGCAAFYRSVDDAKCNASDAVRVAVKIQEVSGE